MSDPQPDGGPPPGPAARRDDDNLLERIDDVIDTALGEDLPEPSEVDPWERRERLLDSWTAVLLGFAALLTAWRRTNRPSGRTCKQMRWNRPPRPGRTRPSWPPRPADSN